MAEWITVWRDFKLVLFQSAEFVFVECVVCVCRVECVVSSVLCVCRVECAVSSVLCVCVVCRVV